MALLAQLQGAVKVMAVQGRSSSGHSCVSPNSVLPGEVVLRCISMVISTPWRGGEELSNQIEMLECRVQLMKSEHRALSTP